MQVAQRKGSVVLRDVRLWHTGVANTSGQVRTMIGIGYAPAWYNGFVIPIVDAVAEVLTELGIPPVSAANGTVAFIEQLGNARRKRA